MKWKVNDVSVRYSDDREDVRRCHQPNGNKQQENNFLN